MTNKPKSVVKTFKEFLESTPPGKVIKVSDLIRPLSMTEILSVTTNRRILCTPKLNLYFSGEDCNGFRFFASKIPEIQIDINGGDNIYILYVCQNCNKVIKTFSIHVMIDVTGPCSGKVIKYGDLDLQFHQEL